MKLAKTLPKVVIGPDIAGAQRLTDAEGTVFGWWDINLQKAFVRHDYSYLDRLMLALDTDGLPYRVIEKPEREI